MIRWQAHAFISSRYAHTGCKHLCLSIPEQGSTGGERVPQGCMRSLSTYTQCRHLHLVDGPQGSS